jgi:hypothetical protein
MAMSDEEKVKLAAGRRVRTVAIAGMGFVVSLSFSLVLVTSLGASAGGIFASLIVAALVAAAVARTARTRMIPEKTRLVLIDVRGRERALPWNQVESFRVERDDIRVRARVDGALSELVGSIAAMDPSSLPREAPLLIPTGERELGGGAWVAMVGFGAVVLFVLSLVASSGRTDPDGWHPLVGLGLFGLIGTGMLIAVGRRARVTAKRDGLHVPGRVIPWHTIEGAAARTGSSTQVRIYMDGKDEVTVFCGDADTAVTEILERRDLAKRMRDERET